jgi:hypothetical protein
MRRDARLVAAPGGLPAPAVYVRGRTIHRESVADPGDVALAAVRTFPDPPALSAAESHGRRVSAGRRLGQAAAPGSYLGSAPKGRLRS